MGNKANKTINKMMKLELMVKTRLADEYMDEFANILRDTIAWERQDNKSYHDLQWDGRSVRTHGWFPVDTEFAIKQVKITGINKVALEVEISAEAWSVNKKGEPFNYIWAIENGVRDTKYPIFAPFKRGGEYATVHYIDPVIEEVILEEIEKIGTTLLDDIVKI